MGVKLHGLGFLLNKEDAERLGLERHPELTDFIRPYRTSRDLAQKPRNLLVIDLYGHELDNVRSTYPSVYQWVLERVKPEREQNKRSTYREKWWLFGEPRRELRKITANLTTYLVTPRTAKHRVFLRFENSIIPESEIVCIGVDDDAHLGVLSSRPHCTWAMSTGSSLGVYIGDIRYNHSRCFITFPFPEFNEVTAKRIADLAEQLDTHRKRQQEQHPGLTMTGMYNVLEKLRHGEPLTDKEKEIHEQGLVSVLRELHDDLDRAVFSAYGWTDLAEKLVGRPGATTPWPEKPEEQLEAEEELLQRLVDLNHQRAAEEARGKVRWLRPEYQAPEETGRQGELEAGQADDAPNEVTNKQINQITKRAWPKSLQEQIRAVRDQLATAPMDAQTLATHYKRKPEKAVNQVLEALSELGMIKQGEDGSFRLPEN